MFGNLGLCLLLLLPIPADASSAQERERLAAQAKNLHQRGRYPDALPTQSGKEEPDFGPMPARPAWEPDLTLVGYLLAGLAGVLLALAVLNRARQPRAPRARRAESGAPGSSAGSAPPTPEPEEPEELARAGRYAEALAALLLVGLRLIGWDPGREQGLTAREVVGRLARGEPRRAALDELLGLAEAVRFAGTPATPEHFEQARHALEAARSRP